MSENGDLPLPPLRQLRAQRGDCEHCPQCWHEMPVVGQCYRSAYVRFGWKADTARKRPAKPLGHLKMGKSDRVYVRFVCFRLVESQRQRLGLFQALDEARDCDLAPSWALRQIGEIYGWFKANLAVPGQFSRGGWKGRGQPGLSWFKPAATEHIKQMHQLKLALEACGVHVEIVTTRDPGHVIWQYEHQLVAEPGSRKF